MRMFHMADLHIGKKLNQVSLLEDQQYMLEQTITLINQQQPDVLLLAGDIYDRRNPSVEAVQLLDVFLSRVVLECRVPVLAISGNHDSGERLGFAHHILSRAGLHIAGRLHLPVPSVTLQDAWGPVIFHLLSYGDLATLRYELQTEEALDYQQAMEQVLQTINLEDGQRHVLLAHGVVAGSEELEYSDSERELTIGGTEFWSSSLLSGFCYVALGHLHSCQRSGTDCIRYAGSPLKYSFSEERHRKGILQVDLAEDGGVTVTQLPLTPLRDMRTIRGNLTDLLQEDVVQSANSQDFIRAVLTDYGELLEPMARLREKYPNALTLEREHQLQAETMQQYKRIDLQKQTPGQLFADFYGQVTGGTMTDTEIAVLEETVQTVQEVE